MSSPKTKARRLPAWFTSPAVPVSSQSQSTVEGNVQPSEATTQQGQESTREIQPLEKGRKKLKEATPQEGPRSDSRPKSAEKWSKKHKEGRPPERSESGSHLHSSDIEIKRPEESTSQQRPKIESQTRSAENGSKKVNKTAPEILHESDNHIRFTENKTENPSESMDKARNKSTENGSMNSNRAASQQLHLSKSFQQQPNHALEVENMLEESTRKPRPPQLEFSKLLEGVIFTISGLVNPERSNLRKMGLDMGAQYRPSWSDDSTLLLCPFTNTPTFIQVQELGGTIVHKDWISKSFEQKFLVPIENYLMHVGNPWRTVSTDNSVDLGVESCETEHDESPITRHEPPSGARLAVESQTMNAASSVDVQHWVMDDLADTITWLSGQSEQPEDLEVVAAQGLLICLEDAMKSLQEDKGLSMVMDQWAFIPRAVKELAAFEAKSKSGKDQLFIMGERFKGIYISQLKQLGFSLPSPYNRVSTDIRTGTGENGMRQTVRSLSDFAEEEVDDDATEIVSDTDSRKSEDFDSDGTVELDEDEVMECKQKILELFRQAR